MIKMNKEKVKAIELLRKEDIREIIKDIDIYKYNLKSEDNGTKKHIDALYKYGYTIYHRKTFKPVSEINKKYS